MALRLQGNVRGSRVTRPCPVCDGEMVKTEHYWQCTNDDCAHREEQ